MSLRTLTYVVKMDVGDGKVKAKDFRITLKTMEQDAEKASTSVDKLAKTIGIKYGANVKTAIDETRTVKSEISSAAREVTRAEKNYARLSAEYKHLTARTGQTAEVQEKMNALHRLGSNATLTQKKEIIKLVNAQQAQVKATNNTQKSMRGLRGQMQNIGYQAQDIAVQMQMGTNAMTIFSQQGSQLAAGFGATGALVGAGIAFAGMLGSVMMPTLFNTGKAIDELTGKMADWANTVGLSKEESDLLISIEQKEIAATNKNIYARAEKIKKLNDEKEKLKGLLATNNKTLIFYSKLNNRLGGEFKTRKDIIKMLSETKAELGKNIALTKADLRVSEERIKKIKDYSAAIGTGLDKQKKWKESNEQAVKSVESQARMIGLSTSAQLELNKAKVLDELSTQKATKAQISATKAAYDKLIANAKLTESEREKAKQSLITAKILSAEAKYTDTGKLAKLESQYAAERKLLAGNQEALKELEKSYNNDRLKITGTFWEKYALSAQENLGSFDEQVANSIDRFSSGFGEAVGNAVFESDNLGDAMATIFKDVGKNMVAFFAEWAAQKLMLWTLDQVLNKTAGTSQATSMTLNAQATSVQAGLNAFSSIAAIPIVGPALAPAAAGAAIAATQPMAAAVSSLSFAGVFDKGGKIPSGMSGIVAEYGDELAGGTMIYNGSPNSLNVTGREDTAKRNGNFSVGGITINSSGNASPNAIARSVVRAIKKGSKILDNAVYESTNRGKNNKGKRYA